MQKKIYRICDLQEEKPIINWGQNYTIAGTITNRTIRLTKKSKEKWAELAVEDLWGSIQVIVFAKFFFASAWLFDKKEYHEPIVITGYLHNHYDDRHRKEGLQCVATELKPLAVEHLKPELYTVMNLRSV